MQNSLIIAISPYGDAQYLKLRSNAQNGITQLESPVPSFFGTLTEQTFWELAHNVSTDVPNFQELREQLDANSAAKALFAQLQRSKSPKVQSRLMGRIRAILAKNNGVKS